MNGKDSINENIDFFLKSVGAGATQLMDALAERVSGKPENLRDGTEFDPVVLPRDLYAHHNVQTEWWYYTGHGKTASGKEFGFELVFFKRRTDEDRFSIVPLRMLGNPIYFAHFAVTDVDGKRFRYAHRKSANGPVDTPASASESHFYLNIGDWSLRESHGAHVLRATASGVSFEANLKPTKSPILNGKAKDGVSYKDDGQASRYFAYTRMEMEGDIAIDGNVEHFTGSAWMDREFGTWAPTENQKGWDWFSIQLDNDTELMCYQLRNSENGVSPYSSGTFVAADGNFEPLACEDFKIEPTGYWKSPNSGATYPSGWRVTSPKHQIDLVVTPVMEDQELDTRGTTMIVYWEGACSVKGTAAGKDVAGRAYVELVGYDRSHDNPNLAYFLLGNSFEVPRKKAFGFGR
jgi:predicted secreted hydrolase